MAFDYDPFDPNNYGRRSQSAGRLSQNVTISAGGRPSGYAPVSSGAPQSSPVTYQPGQINLDESLGAPLMAGLQDSLQRRDRQGIGWMPLPSPYLSFREQRDPKTGDYLSRSLEADYSGMDPAMQQMYQFYLEPIAGRLNRSIADENRVRQQTRAGTQFQSYQQPRMKETLRPDGTTQYDIVEDTLYQPNFAPNALYGALS
jgi:hypothetical protein